MAKERTVDLLKEWQKATEQDNQPETKKERKIFRQQSPTLHRRDVTHVDFFVMARFIHALITVKAAVEVGTGQNSPVTTRMPLVTDMGKQILNLPVWRKTGAIWQQEGYKPFEKDAIAIAVPMMHAIVRYLGIRESAIVNALFNFSMISVDMLTGNEGKRSFRQRFRGKLINPRDGQPLNIQCETIVGIETMSAFILEKKRVNEWIQKNLQKNEQPGG